MPSFIVYAGPTEERQPIVRGDLRQVSDNLAEYKFFWSAEAEDFSRPEVVFSDGTTLELNRTAAGYGGSVYRRGIKHGCNLSRVRKRRGRWAVTVWTQAPEAEAEGKPQEADLTSILEAIR